MIDFIFLKMLFPILYASNNFFNSFLLSTIIFLTYFVYFYGFYVPNKIVFTKIKNYFFVYKTLMISLLLSLQIFILNLFFPNMNMMVISLIFCNLLIMEKGKISIIYLSSSLILLLSFSLIKETLINGYFTLYQNGDSKVIVTISKNLSLKFFGYPFNNYIVFGLILAFIRLFKKDYLAKFK